MNKFISRLMLASATIALGTALIPAAATADDFFNPGGFDEKFGNLVLGNGAGDSDSYTITGNGAVTLVNFADPKPDGEPNGALIVGNFGSGVFNQGFNVVTDPGNLVSVAGDLAIGHQPDSLGAYNLNAGTLLVGGQLSVGGQSTLDNVFNQFSGSVTLTNSANTSGPEGGVNPLYESVPFGSPAFGAKLTVGGGLNDNGGNEGGKGTYNLYEGSIDTTANGIEVGATGTGIMNQFGGLVNTTFLTEGFQGNGTYNLYGGTINAHAGAVGYAGTGAFNQSGGGFTIGLNGDGTLQAPGEVSLTIGAHCCSPPPGGNPQGSGIYTMTGGELHTGNMVVGDGEHGTFIQTTPVIAEDPLVEVTGNLIVGGAQNGSVGSYSITGNDSFLNVKFAPGGNGNDGTNGTYDDGTPAHNQISRPNPNGALIIAQGLADGSATVSGTFTQDVDSHVNVAGDVVVGQNRNATGSYTLSSGDLTIGGKLLVGNSGTGSFNQTGGAVNVTGTAYGNPDYSAIGNSSYNGQWDGAGIAFIGGSWGSDSGTGTYTMSGGTLDAGGLEVGFTATGEMDQSGGVVTAQFLAMGGCGGCAGHNSVGIYRLSGGELNVTFSGEAVGQFGHGEFYQTGGTNNVIGGLNIGDAPSLYADHNGFRYGEPGYTPNPSDSIQPDRSGYYELSGGVLSTDTTVVGSVGLGRFLQTGGEHDIARDLVIGRDFTPIERGCGDADATTCSVGGPARGTYDMEGGTLTANNAVVGDSGVGTFNISGNSNVNIFTNVESETPGGDVVIARNLGSAGSSMTLSSGGESSPTVTIGGYLTVGGGDAGSLTINNGTLTVGAITYVGGGGAGVGTVVQNGGSLETTFLDIGNFGTNGGSYAMNGGQLTVNANLVLGSVFFEGSSGSFTQTGGAVQAGGLYINNTSVYGISAGTLDVTDTIFVGDNAGANAQFNQSGGIVTTGKLVVGNLAGIGGAYHLTGGTLNDDAIVGDAGTGTFDNTGATHNVTGDLTLGAQATGNGTYNLTAGGTTSVTGFTFVGRAGQGTFLNDASTHDTQNLVVADGAGSTSTYTLQNGGALNVGTSGNPGFADIGGHGNGKLVQNGAASATTIYGSLDVGRYAGGIGQVDLNAGSMTVNGFAVIGDSGTGTFNQSGASTMNVVGSGVGAALSIGRGQSNENGNTVITGTGTYNLSGTAGLTVSGGGIVLGSLAGNTGTMNQTGGTVIADSETIGQNGIGHWNQSGGSNTVSGAVIVNDSGTPNGSSLTVSGGSLSAASVTNNDLMTMTGGTVTAPVTNNHQFTLNGGEVVGSVTNNANLDSNGGGTATITGPLSNTATGTTHVSNTSTLVVDGAVTNAGTVTVDTGSKLDASGHTYTQTGGTTTVDGQVAANLAQIILGTLQGTGTVTGNVNNVGGKVRGGDNGAPGALAVTGTYDQQITAAFETTIAGTSPAQVGRLNVGGVATLSGALDVVTQSFTFAAGELFNIMNFASSIGDFTSFSLNGSACSAYIVAHSYTCSGLGSGLYFQEQFANGDTALNLFIAQMTVVEPPTDVPEPMTIGLFVAGIGGVVVIRRRRKAQKTDLAA